MSWNNANERRKFEKYWEKQEQMLKEAGATDSLIKELYEYDLHTHNRERAYTERTVSLDEILSANGFCDEWAYNPLSLSDTSIFRVEMRPFESSGFWWIDEIKNESLHEALETLSEKQKELISLLVYENRSQEQVAKLWGISQQAISKQWNTICLILAQARYRGDNKNRRQN